MAHTSADHPPSVPRLELRGISKAYHWGFANEDVHLRVMPGEIHAVLGENGAGKSTLMQIICGAVEPTSGEMFWDGQSVPFGSPVRARALGIAMVFQHFALFESLSALENMALTTLERMDALGERVVRLSHRYGLPVDLDREVSTLSMGERQHLEIIRALLLEPRLLILDEPTSVLPPRAIEALFQTLQQISSEGCSILYISHKLDEVKRLCHRATLMRNGHVCGTVDDTAQVTPHELARMMMGDDLPPPVDAPMPSHRQVRLRVRELPLKWDDGNPGATGRLNFDLHEGEILGIAGMAGNGQQALLDALSGETSLAAAGSIELDGRDVTTLDVEGRRAAGICFIPEERLDRASVPELSLAENALLTAHRRGLVHQGWIRHRALGDFTQRCIDDLQVRTVGQRAPARTLSGGNLQKFIAARELLQAPRLLLAAEPTWGVDIGAARLLRNRLIALRNAGAAILVVSSDLEELFGLVDRIGVMYRGRMSPIIPVGDASAAGIGMWMAGLFDAPMIGAAPPATAHQTTRPSAPFP